MKIGNTVKRLRLARGMSVRGLGKLCDVRIINLIHIEGGEAEGTIVMHKKIAKAFGLSFDKFLAEIEKDN
ncbi:helix-turn-helix domain-containing protein [Candidatus Omnitrophota bacterium]